MIVPVHDKVLSALPVTRKAWNAKPHLQGYRVALKNGGAANSSLPRNFLTIPRLKWGPSWWFVSNIRHFVTRFLRLAANLTTRCMFSAAMVSTSMSAVLAPNCVGKPAGPRFKIGPIRLDPLLAPLRDDPRFQAPAEKVIPADEFKAPPALK